MEWFYVTRPTRAEVFRLGGAAFGALRRVFQFSHEDVLRASVGRAAHVPGFAGLFDCDACGSHGFFKDDGSEIVGDGDSECYEAILRDCHCHKCNYCMCEMLGNREPGETPFHWICECGKTKSHLTLAFTHMATEQPVIPVQELARRDTHTHAHTHSHSCSHSTLAPNTHTRTRTHDYIQHSRLTLTLTHIHAHTHT